MCLFIVSHRSMRVITFTPSTQGRTMRKYSVSVKSFSSAAQEKRIETSEALLGYLKEQKIVGKSFDEKPVFSMLSAMIKENKVDKTPTCVIKYSSMDVKKYVGTEEIWIGLTKLKTHLATVKK